MQTVSPDDILNTTLDVWYVTRRGARPPIPATTAYDYGLVWFEGPVGFFMNHSGNIFLDSASDILPWEKYWVVEPPYCQLLWLQCAECQAVSFNDYLCEECRGT